MADDVAVDSDVSFRMTLEGRVRIMGFCAQHPQGCNANELVAEDFQHLMRLLRAEKEGKIHYASETTVFMLGKIGKNYFTPVAVASVATCKVDQDHTFHRRIAEDIHGYWNSHGLNERLGPIISYATDGCALFTAAGAEMCSTPIPNNHWMFHIMSPLLLMDLEAHYKNGYTTEKVDHKHGGKRDRQHILSDRAAEHLKMGSRHRGLRIGVIRRLLEAMGVPDNQLVSLIDRRDDKGQDVPLLNDLFTHLTKLKCHDGTVTGIGGGNTYTEASNGIRIDMLDDEEQENPQWGEFVKDGILLGHIAACWLALLVGKKLSISEHLTNLSKLGHLFLTFFRRNQTGFMPPPHYHNTITIVRGTFFSVATCQHFNVPEYYIFQDNDDREEQVFGRMRMAQRSNRNFTVTGLAERMMDIMFMQEYFDEYPDEDSGSKKLSGAVKDHINPTSWEGDVDPSHVDITQCWKAGAALAASVLTADGRFDANELNFDLIATTGVPVTIRGPGNQNKTYEGAATMLKPLGPGYGDNGRVGVSADIVAPAAAAGAAAGAAAEGAAAPAAAVAAAAPAGGGGGGR